MPSEDEHDLSIGVVSRRALAEQLGRLFGIDPEELLDSPRWAAEDAARTEAEAQKAETVAHMQRMMADYADALARLAAMTEETDAVNMAAILLKLLRFLHDTDRLRWRIENDVILLSLGPVIKPVLTTAEERAALVKLLRLEPS